MGACEWCGVSIAQPSVGRRRRYCSDSCKSRAKRERQAFTVLPDVERYADPGRLRELTVQAVADALDNAAPVDPVEQLSRAVGETETLAVEYARLARSTPKHLATRADGMATHLREGLERLFPREDRS